MIEKLAALQAAFQQWRDPINRELSAVSSARRRSIARKLSFLTRALLEGDELGILRYRAEVEQYMDVVGGFSAMPNWIVNGNGKVIPEDDRQRLPPLPDFPTYWISSSTLAESYRFLTQHVPDAAQEPEWMLAVTGIAVKERHMRTLERLVELQLSLQSSMRAGFDMQAFTKMAVTLHNHGQALHGIFHSHRFNGAPSPSSIDWTLQDRLDAGGYPAIQAVFSEDAFVRFFANKPFAVEVYGKGVEVIDEEQHLYQVAEVSTLPHLRFADRARA